MAELRQLSEDAAEALLGAIQKAAKTGVANQLLDLANAYAAVVTNMPRKSASPRGG